MNNVKSLHIIPYYPSVKFTFELTNIVKGKEIHTIGIYIKSNISCKLFIEDNQRYLFNVQITSTAKFLSAAQVH